MEPEKVKNLGPEAPQVIEPVEPQTNEDAQAISEANVQKETPENLEEKPVVEAPLQDSEADVNQPEETETEEEKKIKQRESLKILCAAVRREMMDAGLISRITRPVPVQEARSKLEVGVSVFHAINNQFMDYQTRLAILHYGDYNGSSGSSSDDSDAASLTSYEFSDGEQDINDWPTDAAKSEEEDQDTSNQPTTADTVEEEDQISSPKDLSVQGAVNEENVVAAPKSKIISMVLKEEKESRMRRFWRGIKSLFCCCCVQKPKRCRPMRRTSSSE